MKFEKLQEELYKELVVDIIKQNKKTPNPLNKKELELLLDSGIISDFERMTNKILLILYNTFKETRAEDTLGEIVPFLENYYPVLKSWKGQLIKNYTTSIRQILDRLSLDFKDLKVSNILSNKISLESISSINLGMGVSYYHRGVFYRRYFGFFGNGERDKRVFVRLPYSGNRTIGLFETANRYF